MNSDIFIEGQYIEIGQLLKKIGLIQTGGAAKVFLKNNILKINNKKPEGRSSKVYVGDIVWINDDVYIIKNK